MIKTCEWCWEEFKAHREKQKFCSLKCKWDSQRLPDIPCAVCWKIFHPSKSWVKTCSKECWYKSMALEPKECLYCWKIFQPEHSRNKYCSKECAQRFMRSNKTEEEKGEWIERLHTWFIRVSKTNLSYKAMLENLWFEVEAEYRIWCYLYDFKIWNKLIEINPYAFHNSTRAPKWEPKTNDYHYNKVKYAIDNWYSVIMVRDRTSFDELIQLLDSDFITVQHVPKTHRYNYKTKEHIIWSDYDRQSMEEKWFVLLYDWWEEYIYNDLKD